jgi:hypothetical protein
MTKHMLHKQISIVLRNNRLCHIVQYITSILLLVHWKTTLYFKNICFWATGYLKLCFSCSWYVKDNNKTRAYLTALSHKEYRYTAADSGLLKVHNARVRHMSHMSHGRAEAQAVSRRLRTAAAWVRDMWDLWWTKRHWGRFSPSTSSLAKHSTDCFTLIIIYHPGLV